MIISEIKSRLNIFNVAERLGLQLQGKGNLYRSPFREDRKPSFSISKDGQLFNDFATGDKGDIIGFYKLATGQDTKTAINALANIACIGGIPLGTYRARSMGIPKAQRPKIPHLTWRESCARRLQDLRGYSVESQHIAYSRGVFGFCEYKGLPSWIITDGTGKIAQARRIDGELWADAATGHKAETLKFSDASTPAGIAAIGERKYIALCEGSTDFLAAFHFAWVNDCENEIAPLAMLGATQRINAAALEALRGKIVLIFPDADSAGKKGLFIWGNQIAPYAKVFYFKFDEFHRIDGKPVKDLSDFMALDPDEWETKRPYTNPYFQLLQERYF